MEDFKDRAGMKAEKRGEKQGSEWGRETTAEGESCDFENDSLLD